MRFYELGKGKSITAEQIVDLYEIPDTKFFATTELPEDIDRSEALAPAGESIIGVKGH